MSSVVKQNIINTYCYKCLAVLSSVLEYRNDGKAYILKECTKCGNYEYLIENDWQFLDKIYNSLKSSDYKNKDTGNDVTGIDVTSRCNLHCRHCYYEPNSNTIDKPISKIIEEVKLVKTKQVVIVGAEPTMREDLDKVINSISEQGKNTILQTNGLKLSDKNYVDLLKKTKLDYVSISIQYSNYHNPKVYEKVVRGLWNTVKAGIPISALAWVVSSQQEAYEALNFIIDFEKKYNFYKKHLNLKHELKSTAYLLYAPIRAGRYVKEEPYIFISDLYKFFAKALQAKNIIFNSNVFNGINTPYEMVINSELEGYLTLIGYCAASEGLDKNIIDNYKLLRPNYYVNENLIDHVAHSLAVSKNG